MKKLLVLLTIAVGLFGFSTGAFAQLLDVCSSCEKGTTVGSVACPVDAQGAPAVCGYFDYETGYGYSSGRTVTTIAATTYRAIFSICNCLNAGTTFVAGHRIGIRMTILVDNRPGQNGAYWSQPASANINFGRYATLSDACAADAFVSQFGAGQFFKTDSNGVAISGSEVATLATGTTCAVGETNQATQIITNQDQGYTITTVDETLKLSRWWIDIPEIRIDPTVLNSGQTISVKIETLDQSTGGICAECVATCECTIVVAKVCPTGTSGSSCLFPYFTSTAPANDMQVWWNGIAVVNTSSQTGTATLKVTQTDGTVASYTTDLMPPGSIFVRPLEAIPFTVSGAGVLGNLPVWIKVTTTFPTMDGFGIMADTSTGESMGYLCRKP